MKTKLLAIGLNILYKPYNEYNIYRQDEHLINWGCSTLIGNIIINNSLCIRKGINKLKTFKLLCEHIDMPILTISKDVAHRWIQEGDYVVIRDRIKGSQSKGITIADSAKIVEETKAKFYTKYIHHRKEIRINCYKDKFVSAYDKVNDNKGSFDYKYIKNANEGIPLIIQKMIRIVYTKIGLDIYGLDVLITEEGEYYLLEVNSAPILFPITCSRLVSLIKKDYFNV